MMRGCVDLCLKGFFVLFNLGALIIGLALLIAGSVLLNANKLPLLNNISKVASFVSHQVYLQSACYILIVVGILMMIIVFFGCCGALKSDACCISLFLIVFSVCVAVQLVLGIVALLGWLRIESSIASNAYCTFKKCKPDISKQESQLYVDALNFFQARLQCCGVYNVTDYNQANIMSKMQGELPWQCCILKFPDEKYGVLTYEEEKNRKEFIDNYVVDYYNCKALISSFNSKGCREQIKDWMGTHVVPLAGLCLTILLYEMIVLAMAAWLCCRERRYQRTETEEED